MKAAVGGAGRRTLRTLVVTTLLWGAYGLVYAEEHIQAGHLASWPRALAFAVVALLACWIPLTLILVETARRVTPTRRTLAADVARLALAVAVVLVLHAAYFAAAGPAIDAAFPEFTDPSPSFATQLAYNVRFGLLRVLVLLAIAYAWVRLENTHEHRLRVAELEAGLARARLETLAAQLNPHFMFNALNAIAELIHVDHDAAERMLAALSALLRRSLANPDHEVAVRDEVALVAQYLAIERIRLGDRLDVRWSVEPGCLDARVPALLLQPLAENAIVHGIARRRAPGTLGIDVRRGARTLVLEVANDACRDDAPSRDGGRGIGLANTRARLRCLYGDDWSLTLTRGDTGSIVRVELPLRFSTGESTAAR